MSEINNKLEDLINEYDFLVQEGIIVTEEEKARTLELAEMIQQYAKDLTTNNSIKVFIASQKEGSMN